MTSGQPEVEVEVEAALEVAPAVGQESDWSAHDIVEEWGLQSFPASDAPANW